MHSVLGWWDFLLIAALCLIAGRIGAGFGRGRSEDYLAKRNARKLDAIIKHLGIAEWPVSRPGQPSADVRAFAERGDTIAAIKCYREETGVGLKQAKEAVGAYRITVRDRS